MVFEGNALDLIEENLRVVVADDAVGGGVGVAEVEDEKGCVVVQREEAGHDVAVVAICFVCSERGRRHGDDAVRDVGEVEVETV